MQLPVLAELKRRRVFRTLVGYGIAAFALLQIIEPVMHGLHWPDVVLSYLVVALAAGFPIVVTLAWIFDVKSGGRIERTGPSEAGLRGLPLAALLVGLGLAAALPGVAYYFLVRAPARAPAVPSSPAIAVLPFVNMSSDKENEYFSDGITEELINALANVEGLRVASRTSVFALKGKNLDVAEIGAHLKVNTLLEGSVRREGNELRVTAQLINVSDGYHLWSKSYDREAKGIFAVEDEIARSIADALRRTLVHSEGVKPSTHDLEAHDLYLKGRYFWNKRNLEAFRTAAAYFEQAIAKDPSYALAYTGLADAIALRIDYDTVSTSEVTPRAKAAAMRALEIDPGLAEAHGSLGNIVWHEFDWPRAVQELGKAIELKPDYATAHQWLAETLVGMGRLREAREEIDRALQADPTSLIMHHVAASIRLFDRDYDGALQWFRKALEIDPAFTPALLQLAELFRLQGKYAEAAAELDKLTPSVPPTFRAGARGVVDASSGRSAEALRALAELEEESRRSYVSPALPAGIWIALGDKDRAFPLLHKACAERDAGLLNANVVVAPLFDGIRSDPRYKKLLRCMHLDGGAVAAR
ncbi:MAG TPA: tetratricopeptide repeat protein [Myxococcales bacterium]|nr:tetratricopeptide repeat protein [Myxococcales bacterium]